MALEIERKFLLTNDSWREDVYKSVKYVQGYMGSTEQSSIRIRIEDEKANLNIKSKTIGVQRAEYDYEIPVDEAKEMLYSLCERPLIEKERFFVKNAEHIWEIDVFAGDNEGLIVAEIELGSADEAFSKPGWAGEEVTEDVRYYNVCLVKNPYKDW